MDLRIGQRWRWIYTAGGGSDLILEVVEPNLLKIVQVIKGFGRIGEDYVGKPFSKSDIFDCSLYSRVEYLEGQDKSL